MGLTGGNTITHETHTAFCPILFYSCDTAHAQHAMYFPILVLGFSFFLNWKIFDYLFHYFYFILCSTRQVWPQLHHHFLFNLIFSLSPEGDIKYSSSLLCFFIGNIDCGRDLEKQLDLYCECRSRFRNLELVTVQTFWISYFVLLVINCNRLVMVLTEIKWERWFEPHLYIFSVCSKDNLFLFSFGHTNVVLFFTSPQ